ncbi:MAG: energy transducer TonB, partial [Candidatus Acidiferrum sp.]
NIIAIVFFAPLFLTNAAYCAPQKESVSSDALIAHARSLQLWDEGTPPMKMRAEIQVVGANGATAQGDYTLDWVSPSQSREQIQFANYERLRVLDAQGYWQKSTLDYQPMLIYQLSAVLYIKSLLRVRPKQTLSKIKSREKDGVRQKCVEVKWVNAVDRVLCFDDASGALISVEYPQDVYQGAPEFSRIEFGDFNSASGKLVPHEIRALKGRKVVAALKVLEIAKITEVNPALFKAPANAQLWPQCDDMQDAEPVDRVRPSYLPDPGGNGPPVRVILYGVVEADGSLSHVTIIQGANPEKDSAAFEAFRRWRYKPAQCGQTPIRVETSMYFDFRH